MTYVRSLLYNIFGFSTVCVAATLILLAFWGPYRWRWAITVHWCRLAMWGARVICGIRIEVEGRENMPDTPSVILIKHTSTMETLWQVTAFPRATWVLKREITWAPIVGWAIGLALRPIAIDRSGGASAVKQVIQQGKQKLAEGTWVTIFPEGTRMAPGETRRYGVSGAALARDAAVPIVPVAHNAGDLWTRRSFRKRPGTVRFCIGPTVDATKQRPKETNVIVQNWIESKMHEISAAYQNSAKQDP